MTGEQYLDVDGPVHYVQHGGDGPVMVMVHGLGGSHLSWAHVAADLAEDFKVYAPDLAGFGLTPPAGRSTSVHANRRLVHDFCARISPDEPVVLMGNSMGGLIVMLEAARNPDRVAAAVLVDPALPMVDFGAVNRFTLERLFIPLLPGLGEVGLRHYYATTSSEQQLRDTLAVITADPSTVPADGIAATVALIERRRTMPWRTSAFLSASRSIARVLARRRRFSETIARIECPVLLVHGAEDEIVSPGSARWLASKRPDWAFEMIEGVGHIPQMEAPDLFVDLVQEFLTGVRV